VIGLLAKLTLDKVIDRGEKKLKIKAIEGVLASNELPVKYMDSVPRFHKVNDAISMVIPDDGDPFPSLIADLCDKTRHFRYIRVGNIYTEKEMDYITTWMRRCGGRLAKINRTLAKENEGWEGQVEITI